jgi:hypothetical protein
VESKNYQSFALNRVLLLLLQQKDQKKELAFFEGVFVGKHFLKLKHLGNETGRLQAKNPAFLGFS